VDNIFFRTLTILSLLSMIWCVIGLLTKNRVFPIVYIHLIGIIFLIYSEDRYEKLRSSITTMNSTE